MSDLYLDLHSRIPVVAAKTRIGTAHLQAAQDAVGLSNEGIAREIPVSEKTWRRWKDEGTVPTYALPKIAKVLRLELVEAPREKVEWAPLPENGNLEALAAGVRDLLDGQREILQRLEALQASGAAPPRRQQVRPKPTG